MGAAEQILTQHARLVVRVLSRSAVGNRALLLPAHAHNNTVCTTALLQQTGNGTHLLIRFCAHDLFCCTFSP
jgi:hypothetical protein